MNKFNYQEDDMRVFFAICFDGHANKRIAEIRDMVRFGLCDVSKTKYTSTSNLHMTLWYVGQVDPHQLNHCFDVLKQIKSSGFSLKIDCFKEFSKKSGDIVWLGSTLKNPALADLYRKLYELLFPDTEIPIYHPHITLARNGIWNGEEDQVKVKNQIEMLLADNPLVIDVQSVHLMRSHRMHGELTYTSLLQIDLR